VDVSWLLLATGAAASFAAGGAGMRATDGFTRPLPTVCVMTAFVIGMYLNARLVRRGGEVGPAYLAVVACETVLVVLVGAVLFSEPLTVTRLAAVAMVLGGILLLADVGS
jgi:multidrug transporter EmrE-like cation transporter